MSMKVYQAGIDIGSTTVKLVVTDEEGRTLFSDYRRHCARTQETLADLLRDVRGRLGSCCLRVGMTGSGALSLADALHVTFEQEVVAVAEALEAAAPGEDVNIGPYFTLRLRRPNNRDWPEYNQQPVKKHRQSAGVW